MDKQPLSLIGTGFSYDVWSANIQLHHVPVIIDDGLRIIESLAILDYLEVKYPQITLIPQDANRLAVVKMAQMVVTNELTSQIVPLIIEEEDIVKLKQVKRKIQRVLQFLSQLLADDDYFGGECLSTGDIVAGNGIILLSGLGLDLNNFPKLEQWCDRLMSREIWQKTQPNRRQLKLFKQTIKSLVTINDQ